MTRKPAPFALIIVLGAALIALAIAASATGRTMPTGPCIPLDDFSAYLYSQEPVVSSVTDPELDPRE
jgi:hypothetical protein